MAMCSASQAWTLAVVLNFLLILATEAVSEKYKLKEVKLPSDLTEYKIYTDEDISKYDGTNLDLPLLMAVKGVVFDVSSGKSFYGKGAAYNALTGKDASRAVAMMSLEKEDLNHDLDGLSDRVLRSLDEVYESVYVKKYPVVGYMDYFIQSVGSSSKNEL